MDVVTFWLMFSVAFSFGFVAAKLDTYWRKNRKNKEKHNEHSGNDRANRDPRRSRRRGDFVSVVGGPPYKR